MDLNHVIESSQFELASFPSRPASFLRLVGRWVVHLVAVGALLTALPSLSGCSFYSFTGAAIPSHLETIAIPIAEDNTASPVNNLGRDLSSLLTDRFVDRTRLSLTTNDAEADALLTARIQRYTNEPTGVSGDERATTNQVSIQVQVRYVDQTEDEELLNQSFSGTGEYDPTESGLAGEQEALRAALERVADDIFSTATSNW